ncbi:hypothetical protein O159_12160 [Leifsonia xyli subsp. cynodontis DSM 46306]|jgi:hypothetical protein|uniref:Uncharacterized protein n=1 Tax=Leifsonia xyli subsp. cynodontis DSM 46306 TaxID=1389489 RepID=U3P660_LEIXC|nr:hypothetical protein [Leifsonia xyli]AGW41296.1 hypothetical protein O159_12160 [Leifsonia xyli subsp. cynodontis DSM 46306]
MANIIKVAVDGEQSVIDVDKLTFAEGRAIEKVTGKEFAEAIKSKSLTSIQALIWVTWKRHHPGVAFSDFDDRAITDIEIDLEKDDGTPPENPTVPAVEG